MARDRGFALLIVLWSLVLLSLIITRVISSGRTEAQLAGNLRNAAVAQVAADGAVHEAIFHLLAAGPQSWPPRGTHDLQIGRSAVRVTVENIRDEINPNTAGEGLLRALFGLCGASAAEARQAARSILIWRGEPDDNANLVPVAYRAAHLPYLPPRQPMQTLEEMGLVLGMRKPLLACVMPHVSLFQDGIPDVQSEDRLVARAVAIAAQDGDMPGGGSATSSADAVRITAIAQVAGAQFTRQASVRLTGNADGRLFRILTWNAP